MKGNNRGGMGMRKHARSGRVPKGTHAKLLVGIDAAKAQRERAAINKAKARPMYATVKEALKK